MTIYDFDTEVTVTAPGDGVPVTYSDSYELLDSGGTAAGTAAPDGVPQLFGGGQLYMQFEVTTAFTVGAGAPLAQFGVAIDNVATLTTTAHVLAMTGGSIATNIGIDAAGLTLARTFHLAIPSWEDIMEITDARWPDTSTATERDLFRLFRYMGVVIQQPMPVASSANYFGAGAVKARICTQATVGTAVGSNQYPAGMTVT
jgi:hypothetical protein